MLIFQLSFDAINFKMHVVYLRRTRIYPAGIFNKCCPKQQGLNAFNSFIKEEFVDYLFIHWKNLIPFKI